MVPWPPPSGKGERGSDREGGQEGGRSWGGREGGREGGRKEGFLVSSLAACTCQERPSAVPVKAL